MQTNGSEKQELYTGQEDVSEEMRHLILHTWE